jgi:hypothetical protein
MTMAMKFDPVKYIQDARKIGFSQDQAEFNTQEFERVINTVITNQEFGTKRDLAELKLELIKWMLGIGTAGVLAIAGLLKFMIH